MEGSGFSLNFSRALLLGRFKGVGRVVQTLRFVVEGLGFFAHSPEPFFFVADSPGPLV